MLQIKIYNILECLTSDFKEGSDGNAYYYSETKKNIEDAMEHCKDLDSKLAHANNEKERNAIFEFILQQSLKGGYSFLAFNNDDKSRQNWTIFVFLNFIMLLCHDF